MNYLYVANWKMNMHFNNAVHFCTENADALQKLTEKNNDEIILSPSFVALQHIIKALQKTNIGVSAQNCSEYKSGAYTGEVSAQSLAEIGCRYCIVGHSERRQYFGETNSVIAQKVEQLLTHNIQPIMCIGETEQEYLDKKTEEVLLQQLTPIIEVIKKHKTHKKIIIAYEPVWSIGTGIIPQSTYLENVFVWLKDTVEKKLPNHKAVLLYGGSVNQDNIVNLKQILYIQGFLVGGASNNFETFKAIIENNKG